MDPLLQKINDLYGLAVTSSERVTKGFLSENFILTQGDTRYFLKHYRISKEDRIAEIHSVKKYFAENGIPVIRPITHKEGGSFFLFEGGYYALFPFVQDQQFERGTLTDAAIVSLGAMLGKLHLAGKKAALPMNDKFKYPDKEKAFEKIDAIHAELMKKTEHDDFDKRALESIETKKRLILANPISHEELNLPCDHLIHGDYLDHNVFYASDDTVSYVFDFEKTNYSPRTFEMYRSLMYSFLSNEISDETMRQARLFLSSYLSVYLVSQAELLAGLKLFYLKQIHSVWVEGEHYLKNNTRVDEFLAKDFSRTLYLSEHFEEFEKKLISK